MILLSEYGQTQQLSLLVYVAIGIMSNHRRTLEGLTLDDVWLDREGGPSPHHDED